VGWRRCNTAAQEKFSVRLGMYSAFETSLVLILVKPRDDGSGPAISGGMMFVNSGYAIWGGMPGNVLLAFSVDGR
jgi:hypothetical protein